MRIGLNARILSAPELRGWQRYAFNLALGLLRCQAELTLYSDQPLAAAHAEALQSAGARLCVHAASYPRWQYLWLPAQLRRDGMEIFHSPFNFGLPLRGRARRVLTLHDAIGARGTRRDPAYWHAALARRAAAAVIAVSRHAAREITACWGVPAEKIAVIYEAADERFHQPLSPFACDELRQRHRLPARYVLYLGGWEGRKNVGFLLRGFQQARLDPDIGLVLAGGRGPQLAALQAEAGRLGLTEPRLRLLPWVEDRDLPALYAAAWCFVYPSRHEGFGLQLCEAMAAGVPVLAARATSLPEILGDGGETFSLDQPGELVAWLRRLALQPALADDLRQRARRRALCFSWQQTAQATLALYQRLLAARRF